jgi:hypothetical protein
MARELLDSSTRIIPGDGVSPLTRILEGAPQRVIAARHQPHPPRAWPPIPFCGARYERGRSPPPAGREDKRNFQEGPEYNRWPR